ncbi:MAG: hypothetical protein HY273_11950 [Gammaproteobacteria bacterium]|nr:hypothetical protein [Gammaproteobacteria bacterium]
MTEGTPTDVLHPSNELRILRSKKETLQNVIKIARALSRLHQGLQAVLLLGRASSKVPKHAVRFYDALSEDVKQLPSNTLQQDLIAVDRLVRQDFDNILTIADANETHFPAGANPAHAAESSKDDARIHKLLDEFRRRAQTAVCLRVILRERGIATTPLALPVPEAKLQRQIAVLEKKETQYKVKIRTDVAAMKNDVEILLKNTAFPEAIKQELRQTQLGLQKDIEHIDAGKDLDDLPFPIEAVESAETSYAAPPLSAVQARPVVGQKQTPPAVPPPPLGFFRKLWLWLTNPMREPWSKIGTENSSRRPHD